MWISVKVPPFCFEYVTYRLSEWRQAENGVYSIQRCFERHQVSALRVVFAIALANSNVSNHFDIDNILEEILQHSLYCFLFVFLFLSKPELTANQRKRAKKRAKKLMLFQG